MPFKKRGAYYSFINPSYVCSRWFGWISIWNTNKWSLLTLYGLFSKNKKQIAFSLFSGGRGGLKWGRDGVWGLVSRRRTTPDPIETPFGPPQPPEYRENKIDIFLFWEKTYNVNTNLSLSWAYFGNSLVLCNFTLKTIPKLKNEPPDPSLSASEVKMKNQIIVIRAFK